MVVEGLSEGWVFLLLSLLLLPSFPFCPRTHLSLIHFPLVWLAARVSSSCMDGVNQVLSRHLLVHCSAHGCPVVYAYHSADFSSFRSHNVCPSLPLALFKNCVMLLICAHYILLCITLIFCTLQLQTPQFPLEMLSRPHISHFMSTVMYSECLMLLHTRSRSTLTSKATLEDKIGLYVPSQ